MYNDEDDTDEKEFEDNDDDNNADVDSYCKIPKISPSMYKPRKLLTQKNLRIWAPRDLYSEISLKDKIKQSKNRTITPKFPSNF